MPTQERTLPHDNCGNHTQRHPRISLWQRVPAPRSSDLRKLHRAHRPSLTSIDKLGTPEHGTENETDDIHVDFFEVEYSYDRVIEIEDALCTNESRCFDDLPLDDVIMAPAMLIRLPGAEFDELDEILNSYDAAKAWVENTLAVCADN